jgi:crotonobetainyl-CoA:carnitine CoA-transferase CaiB-like acyl-CoA transferase
VSTALMTRPLAGLRVLEVGSRPGVRACGSILRDLGADVVVVEDPRDARSPSRAVQLAGKGSITAQQAPAEAAAADILLTSTDVDGPGPGRLPGQIRCDVTAFGATGPLSGIAASEALVQAWSGTASVTGHADGPPRVTPAPLLEMEAGAYAAAGVLAALAVRDAAGTGQDIDIALYDVGVNALAVFLPLAFAGRNASRTGNRHAILSPWNTYPTRDGWVMICAPTDDQWRRLCDVLGAPELGADPRFASTGARLDRADDVDRLVGDWTSARSIVDILAALAASGIASGPILGLDDLEHEPNVRHRGMIVTAMDERGEAVLVPGNVFGGDDVGHAVPTVGGDDRLRPESPAGPPDELPIGGSALAGVRVIEIGMNTVAPLAARQLGALGADVIKVEPPAGDVNRSNAPLRADGEAYIFAISNTDKRGVVLDLRNERDAAVLWALLETADVVVENLKPGSLSRLGFGPEQVQDRLPSIIYCSVSGFGHDSAYPGRPALDTVIQAMSGTMAPADGAPVKAGISIADQLGGQFALVAILAALRARGSGGPAARIDLAMQDVTAWATASLWNGAEPEPTRVLAGSDGHVVVTGLGDAEIVSRLNTTENGLEDAARALTRANLVAQFQGAGAPVAAPVITVAEVLDATQTVERGLIVRRPSGDGDTWPVLESPLRLERTPARTRTAMSRLGVIDLALLAEFPALVPDTMRVVVA